jgi:hypothetical protein
MIDVAEERSPTVHAVVNRLEKELSSLRSAPEMIAPSLGDEIVHHRDE